MISETMEVSIDEVNRATIASRIIKAPKSLVYKLFTSPEHIDKWYGPKGCHTVTSEMDVKQGGVWKYTMNMPNGNSFDAFHIFTEVIKDEKLAFDSAQAKDAPDDQWFNTRIDFKDQGGDTEITITMTYKTDKMFEQAKQMGGIRGYASALEKLEEYIAKLE